MVSSKAFLAQPLPAVPSRNLCDTALASRPETCMAHLGCGSSICRSACFAGLELAFSVPYLQRYKFADLIAELAGLDCWLEDLGLKSKQDRVHFAIDVLHQAENAFQRMRATGEPARAGNVDNYIFGICEALEIRDIYLAFRDEPKDKLAPILERALSGPHRPADETERNTDGRNIAFELALGAELKLRGADVTLAEPDLRVSTAGGTYLLACKRPAREQSIRAAIRSASQQLDENLQNSDQDVFGVMTISVSRILNPGTLFFGGHLERFGDRVQALLADHNRDSERAIMRHPSICAILFHAATPNNQGDGLFRMSYSVLSDCGRPSEAFRRFGLVLKPVYNIE